jgi:hypothetical protein
LLNVTVTVSEELRDTLRANQRDGYALRMKAAARRPSWNSPATDAMSERRSAYSPSRGRKQKHGGADMGIKFEDTAEATGGKGQALGIITPEPSGNASLRFRDFFTANIRNPNTRAAHAVAVRAFFGWLKTARRPSSSTWRRSLRKARTCSACRSSRRRR